MHVKAKRIATAGLLVAFTVVLVLLSSYVESSSLFFLVAAAFCVGIAIREWGAWFGFAFLVASTVLNLVLAPNKLYCVTFVGIGLYIWLYELIWKWIANSEKMKKRTLVLWFGKYAVFNVLYVPTLFLAPELLFTGKVNGIFVLAMLLLGQVALLIFDYAYRYFQSHIWGKMRGRFME